MNTILIGTSGWQFPALQTLSIKKTGPSNILEQYATLFNTVENNSAFYHRPRLKTLQNWYDITPNNFVFSLKLHRSFTHEYYLQLNDERIEQLKNIFKDLQILKHKLGAFLIQTPPGLKYDLSVLKFFLKTVSNILSTLEYKPDIAMEFRNESWFSEEVYDLLRFHHVGLVMSDSKHYPLRKIITTDFVYIRFHGHEQLFRSTYLNVMLDEWIKYLQSLKGIQKTYIYFNNTLSANVIDNAQYMLSHVQKD